MRLLFLCEGDAEHPHGSFSGISHSILNHLRAAGHWARTADVDLYGLRRWLAAAATFTPISRRWSVRYHLGAVPFRLRSRLAARALRRAGADSCDAILQIGATFASYPATRRPVFLYCDSNIRMAERGAESGQSQAAWLEPGELEAVVRREAGVYRNAAGIFAISERLRRSFVEDFGLPSERVHTVYAGPNFPAPVPPVAPRPADRPPTVLFVGVRFERKGGDLLLRAFTRLRERVPGARLRIIGPRALEIRQDGVECLGFLRKDEPSEWARLVEAYREADVFCLPTRYEPFGIVFVEAMAFGLPCVGPAAWAIPEMVVDGETGFLVPPEDPDALADRLVRLLEDPELARRMGAAGRTRAERYFTWPAVIRRMTDVMEGLVAGGSHSRVEEGSC